MDWVPRRPGGHPALNAISIKLLCGTGLRATCNEQDAFDVAQEAFVRAFERIVSFDGRSRLGTWLYRIASNEALQLFRRRDNEQRHLRLVSEQQDRTTEPGAEAGRQELEDALGQLSELHRVILVLRYQEGLSYDEITDVLEIAPGTVASRLNRARAELRGLLGDTNREEDVGQAHPIGDGSKSMQGPAAAGQTMSTGCEDIRPRLGEFLDGELAEAPREQVQQHVTACDACREESARLESLTRQISGASRVTAPDGLWTAIESRLDGHSGQKAKPGGRRATRPLILRVASRPLAAAAALLVVIGLGWLAVNPPWGSRAIAGQMDFRPLLERADGDIGAGIQALMQRYGGEPISASAAEARMTVRVHAPEQLPHGLKLRGRYLLNMGRSHQALAFHYAGPSGEHLLLLQCPSDTDKNYGDFECVACSVGDHNGRGVKVGKLHLMHMASDNVCVCVVSTLHESNLATALDAVPITF